MRQTDSTELETDRDRRRRRDRHRDTNRDKDRQTETDRQNLKTLLLKDSSVRSIWTFLIQTETDRVCMCCVIANMYIDRYGLFVHLPYFHSPSPSLTRTQRPSLTNRSLIRSLFLSLLMHRFQLVRFFLKSVEIRIVFNNDPIWDFSRYKSKSQSVLILYKILPVVIAILISPGSR